MTSLSGSLERDVTDSPGITSEPLMLEKRVSWLFIAVLFCAQTLFFISLLGPAIIGISVKVQTLVPADQKTTALALVATLGALSAVFSNVIFGRLSDRTTGRFGRRRPWIIGGTITMLCGLAGVAAAPTTIAMALAWALTQAGANMVIAPFYASAADRVPKSQRGLVTSLMGLSPSLGVMGGVYIAKAFVANMWLLFVPMALIAVVAMLLYCIVLPDQRMSVPPPRLSWKEILQTFYVNPRLFPDFSYAWLSRCLIEIAMYLFVTYRLFFIQDRLMLPVAEAALIVSTGVLCYTLALMPSALIAGKLSDKTGKRKVFVGFSAVVFAIGTVLLAFVHDAQTFYIVEALLGLSYGVYMGVDLALVMDVLPDQKNPGKDLGIFNIAKAFPQAAAPAIGATLLAVGADGAKNYTFLLVVAGIIGIGGALAVIPIKKVR
ncbi:MFS transporter [Rhizobium sp. CFBP 8762]|uniref:MFS transporter n=1 Tax=Rhizobium sp. CFBP 8762 TaxID=2775279 RepID=UPI001781F92D|nr:MFS transporter [Rhizobium sp. CFBP 8762]MBD8554514.1 MFS transporter [Rhizobium sp. CFBP 8762]